MNTSPSELNPGSYNEFLEREGLTNSALAKLAFFGAVTSYRRGLAVREGKTLEQLHEGPFDYSEQDVA